MATITGKFNVNDTAGEPGEPLPIPADGFSSLAVTNNSGKTIEYSTTAGATWASLASGSSVTFGPSAKSNVLFRKTSGEWVGLDYTVSYPDSVNAEWDPTGTALVDPVTGALWEPPRLSGQTAYPGFFTKRPLSSVAIPFGTSGINDKGVTGTTVSTAVDAAVIFNGKPSTKCTVAAGGTGPTLDVGVNAASITLDGTAQGILTASALVAVKVGTGNTVSSGTLYLGDSSYTNFYTFGLAVVGEYDDWILLATTGFGPASTTGTPNLAAAVRGKVRVTCGQNVAAGDIWISECYVLPKSKPTVVFTVDDGYDEWAWLATEAAKRGIPISFGIAKDYVGTAGFLTESQMLEIANHSSGLFELTNHARINSSYATLGLAAYRADMDACRDYLVGLGCDSYAANCHQYVQGSFDQTLIASIKAAGYISAREVGSVNRHAQGHSIAIDGTECDSKYKIPATINLDSAYNLAAVQSGLTNAAQNGGAFVMGHKFEAAAGALTWINGYDASYGVLNLLDWLAQKRDEDGWQILKWSEWAIRVHAGHTAGSCLL